MAESVETHEPKVGDRYSALTGAMLEWEVVGTEGMVMLQVEEPSWRDHQARLLLTKGPAGKRRDRRRRPRPLYLTREQLANPKRWELIEAAGES